jgi:hypothetical protein
MQTIQLVLWVIGIEAGLAFLCFIIFPNFCRRWLARVLAVSLMFRDAGKNYSNHFQRILGIEPNRVQEISGPIVVVQSNRPSPTEEMAIDALKAQGATQKKATEAVFHFRDEGVLSFDTLFRKASNILASKKKVMSTS